MDGQLSVRLFYDRLKSLRQFMWEDPLPIFYSLMGA